MSAVEPDHTTYHFKVKAGEVADLIGTSGGNRRVIRPDVLKVSVYADGRMSVVAEGHQVLIKDGSLGGIRGLCLGYGPWDNVQPPVWAQEAVRSLGVSWDVSGA